MPPIRRLTVLLSAMVVAPAPLFAQNDQPPQEPQTLVAFESAAVSEVLSHPKDAGLRRAIGMIPARLRELPAEIPELGQAPGGIFDLIGLAFEGPYRVAIVSLGADPQSGMPRIVGEIALGSSDRAGAEAAQRALAELASDVPQLERDASGALHAPTPMGEVRIGAYEGAGGKWWFGVRLGDQGDVAGAYAALPGAADGRTLMRGSMDLSSMIAPLKMMGAMMAGGNPEAAAGMEMLENSGVLDMLSLRLDSVVWRNDAGIHSRTVAHNARAAMGEVGLAGGALTAAQLGAIPADALAASVTRSDTGALLGWIELLRSMGPDGQRALDAFTDATGVDLEHDVIGSLDGVYAVYSSDATGGSGMMSWVALAGIGDHEAMRGAMRKLTGKANELAHDIPFGSSNGKYLRLAHAGEGGVDFVTFQTPGIPAPFSLTVALTDRWLVAGLSRQSVSAAVMQATGRGDGGLLTSAAFLEQWPHGPAGVSQINFLDTQRAIRKGYGMATLLGGMLENGVRSPLGADREPGMIVPTYNELVRGSRASVKVTRWEGDDLVITTHSDGSAVVNITAMGGVFEPVGLFFGAGMAAGIVGGAVEGVKNIDFEDGPPF